jgi:hypothetical protein
MIVVSLMVNELTLWRASVRQIAVVTNKYIPYIVKFVFYKGICQFHFDVKVVNMKSTICAALNIPMFHKQQHSTNKQWNRNQQNKNNRRFRQNRKQELK